MADSLPLITRAISLSPGFPLNQMLTLLCKTQNACVNCNIVHQSPPALKGFSHSFYSPIIHILLVSYSAGHVHSASYWIIHLFLHQQLVPVKQRFIKYFKPYSSPSIDQWCRHWVEWMLMSSNFSYCHILLQSAISTMQPPACQLNNSFHSPKRPPKPRETLSLNNYICLLTLKSNDVNFNIRFNEFIDVEFS